MKKHAALLLLTIILSSPLFSEDNLYYRVSARLLVKDRQKTSENLSDWAEREGGYFTLFSLERLSLRIPDTKLETLKELLEAESEEIIEYSQTASDLREEILLSRSHLKSREELLARNMEYLDRSDFEGTLTLENEIRRLMQEIDSLKGRLKKYENDSAYAYVDLNLSFRNQSIPVGRPSRFEWINSMDFYSFINSPPDMPGGVFRGPRIPLPEGFALADTRPWFRALSPEGVQIRLRTVKNYPLQNREFWSEALFSHLEELGYIPMGESGTLSLDEGEDFTGRAWGVPLGQKDYIYLTALRIRGKRIEIVEIAGEAEYLRKYFRI